MAAAVWNRIKLLMDGSIFFRFVERVINFIARLFSGSVITRFLSDDTDGGLKNSSVYKAVLWLFKLPEKIRDKFFARTWDASGTVRFVKTLPNRILSLTLRDTGLGILTGLGVCLIFPRHLRYIHAYIFAAALLCLFSKERLYALICGSGIMRFIAYLFDFSLPKIKYSRSNAAYSGAYGIFGGILFNLASFGFLPAVYAAALFLAPLCALLVIAYPFIGVLAIVFLMPFIPTMMMAALIGGVYALFFLKLLTDKRYHIKLGLTGLFILLYIIINLFKGFTSLAPATSVNIALLTSLFMAVYFLVVSITNSRKKFELLIFVFVTSALFTGLYGFMQVLSGQRNMTWVDKKLFEELGMRVFSTFLNPNVYGEYLLLAIPVAIAAIVFVKRPLMKLYYTAVSAVLLVNLGLTYSRGCYLAIVFAVFVFVLIMEKRLIAFLSAGIFILPAVLPASMLNRLLSITNLEDSSSKYRLSIYQASVRLLQRFWPSGIGQGYDAFNRAFPLYAFNGVTASHSHNLFLQVFIETGIFGFLAFLAIFLCYYKSLVPVIYKTKDIKYKWMAAVLMALMAGFVLQSLFDYSFYNYKVYMLFFVVLAFAEIVRNHSPQAADGEQTARR